MRETIAWRDRLPRNHAHLEHSSHVEALHRNRIAYTVCLGSFLLGWGPYPQTNVGHVRKVVTSLGKEPLFAVNVLQAHTQKLLEARNAPIVPEALTSLGKEPLFAENVLQAHTQNLLEAQNAPFVHQGSFNLTALLLCVWTVLLESTSPVQEQFHAWIAGKEPTIR